MEFQLAHAKPSQATWSNYDCPNIHHIDVLYRGMGGTASMKSVVLNTYRIRILDGLNILLLAQRGVEWGC